MEGWVDLGYPAMERPGVELATSRSLVRRPNHYTTEPTTYLLNVDYVVATSAAIAESMDLVEQANVLAAVGSVPFSEVAKA